MRPCLVCDHRKRIIVKQKNFNQFPRHEANILPPPPLMVLNCKFKVSKSNGDECCDNDKPDEQNVVDCVNLVPPYASKNVEEFDVDSTERKKSRHAHLGNSQKCHGQM